MKRSTKFTDRIRMETTYWNLTNSSNATDELHTSLGPGFTAFIIILSLVLAVIITFDGLIAIMLLLSTLLTVPVQVLLINNHLLLIRLITAVTAFCSFLYTVALSLSDTVQPSLPFCQFSLWAYSVTSEARLLGLLAFSVTVQRIVAGGMGKLGAKWLILCLIATWVTAILSRIDIIIPPIYGVTYTGRIACFPTKEDPEYQVIGFTYFFMWIALACFLPLVVCLCVITHTLLHQMTYHLRRRSIQESSDIIGVFIPCLHHMHVCVVPHSIGPIPFEKSCTWTIVEGLRRLEVCA